MVALDQPRASKPSGFGLFTRIVYIHQALSLAFFIAALRVFPRHGFEQLVLPHGLGIALSVAVLLAVFGVSSRHSLKALGWLRVILWISVIKILVVQLWLISKGEPELAAYVRGMLINELIAIPLAIYWSRPVHRVYLASFRRSSEPL